MCPLNTGPRTRDRWPPFRRWRVSWNTAGEHLVFMCARSCPRHFRADAFSQPFSSNRRHCHLGSGLRMCGFVREWMERRPPHQLSSSEKLKEKDFVERCRKIHLFSPVRPHTKIMRHRGGGERCCAQDAEAHRFNLWSLSLGFSAATFSLNSKCERFLLVQRSATTPIEVVRC